MPKPSSAPPGLLEMGEVVEVIDQTDAEAVGSSPERAAAESIPGVKEREPGTAVEVATTTDVAVAPTGALAAFAGNEWDGVDSGLENWQHVGFTLPRIVSDMRPGGGWTDEATNEKVDALSVIFLAAMPARAYWKDAFGTGDAAPDCRSVDMEHADPQSPAMGLDWAAAKDTPPPTGTCATCPLSRWDGEEPPACRERINSLVYYPDSGEIRRLTIGGTSVKHFRRYVSALQARARRLPLFAQVTDVTLEEVDNGKMRWLEAHFAEGEPVSPQQARGTLIPLQQEVAAAWKSLVAQDLASPDADGTAVARGGAIDADSYAHDEEPF